MVSCRLNNPVFNPVNPVYSLYSGYQQERKIVGQNKPDRTVDTSGTCCPEPLKQAHRAIKAMQPGEVLELICTDIGSRMDIPAWCQRTGHELLRVEEEGKTFRYYGRKRGQEPLLSL